jgi:DNA-binding transcriptional LysR family regulator
MLDAHRLRLLSEFAEHGSIAATAAALGYTPSAVSQQLTALEREAGAVLLDRTARSAELTDAGRRLADHGRRILAMIEAAEADLSARAEEPEGRVVVTAFPTAAAAFAPALAHSLRVHPGLTLLLRQTQRGEGLRQVRSGGADVALVDDWSGRLAQQQGQQGQLIFHRLIRDPLVLVVPRSHPVASQQRVQLRGLREEAWMVTPEGEPSRQAVDRLFANAGGAPPVSWEFEGLGTILSLVARGIGIAAVPRLALAAGAGRVAVRELRGAVPARDVYAVVRASSVRRPTISAVLAALRAGAKNLPGQKPRGADRRPAGGPGRSPAAVAPGNSEVVHTRLVV